MLAEKLNMLLVYFENYNIFIFVSLAAQWSVTIQPYSLVLKVKILWENICAFGSTAKHSKGDIVCRFLIQYSTF